MLRLRLPRGTEDRGLLGRSMSSLLGGVALVFATTTVAANSANTVRDRPMTFQVFWPCSGNSMLCAPRILAQGVITNETPARFAEFWKSRNSQKHHLPDQPTMVFNSGGGSLAAAMELGRQIRALRIDTAVARSYDRATSVMDSETFVSDAICASACVFAFAGGITRISEEDQALGVHQFAGAARDLGEAAAQITVVILADYLRSMGVDRSILDIGSLVPAKEIRFLSTTEAARASLDNASPRQTDWRLDAAPDGTLAGTATHYLPIRGLTTKLALFRSSGVIHIAVAVSFTQEAYGKPRDALQALNGSTLVLAPKGARPTKFVRTEWSLKDGYVLTLLTLDAITMDAIRRASHLKVDTDTARAVASVAPYADFELRTLHPLLPAILKH